MNGYTEIEHTADIGLKVWADSYTNLFRYAMYGFYKLVLKDNYSCGNNHIFTYSESDYNYENLLISFLSEINFKLMAEKQILKSLNSLKISNSGNEFILDVNGLICQLINPDEYLKTEIKAVTYHQSEIVEDDGIFRTKIFFDV